MKGVGREMGARNELGATLQSTSEGGRQRIGSKVNSEQLQRGLVLERESGMVNKH